MRRQSQDEVTEAARRRLELLRRELSNAGIEPVSRPPAGLDAAGEVAESTLPIGPPDLPATAAIVAPAGRHVRRTLEPGTVVGGWIADRLPPTLRGRIALGARDLVVLALLAAVGLALAAVVVLRSGAGRGPSPLAGMPSPGLASGIASGIASGPVSVPPAGVGGPAASGAPVVGGSPGAEVTVDVAGRVRRPGVVTLPAGSRVVDALRRAGGPRGHVDLSTLNLARVLSDGEQILVGRTGMAASAASTPGAPPGGPLVNINTATEEQLEQLPDVGPVTAQKILAWRSAHGSFSSVDELLEVDGIGNKTLADLAPYVTL